MTRFEKVKMYIEDKGGEMISSSVHWNKGNFEWICNNGHNNSSKLQMLERRSWCRKCIEDSTKNKVLNSLRKGYTLINFSPKSCEILCEKNHNTFISASHIIEGNGCGICYRERLKSGVNRLSITEVRGRLAKVGFEFLDSSFKSLMSFHSIKCNEGHVVKQRLQHVITGKVGCSRCNNYFKSERKFRDTVERIFNVPFPKSRPEWLTNPNTGYKLELDCYNEELKLAFEYDGHFHFEVRKGLNNDLTKTKELDSIKEKLCIQNGVRLIRVPHFAKGESYYNLLIEGFKMIYGENYWKVFRFLETGVEVPEGILDARRAARLSIIK